MKRSDFFIRLTTGLLFLAVASYIGVYIYFAIINVFETTPAISYSIEESVPAHGYIVRTEVVLPDSGFTVLPIVREGERVASGQAVAIEYLSQQALETAGELRVLRLRIEQLEAIGGAGEASGFDSVMALSTALQHGDLSRLDELAFNIDTHVFSGGYAQEYDVNMLRARLAELERLIAGTRTIYAPVSGNFSQVVDGFEHIGPEDISDIFPSQLGDLFVSRAGTSGTGKLMTEFKWYYAANMSMDDAMRLSTGQRITLQFFGAYNAEAEMFIERIGRREDGMCVVLFSSDRGIHNIAPFRYLRAEIVLDVISGILVPKEAIHLDDYNNTFVYLQTGVRAERVEVDILMIIGENYLVRDGVETGSPLRADATIIVKANNLYDGKVVG